MKRLSLRWTAVLLLLASGALYAQNPTGSVSGRVTSADEVLPGVAVSVSSPSLQGTRSTVTGASGDYLLPLLPAGSYEVSFDLETFQPQQHTVVVNAAQNTLVNADLAPGNLTETITVTVTPERLSTASGAAVTIPIEQVEELPMERNIRETVLLQPGVSANGPNANLVINGAMSFESLYLVDGVVVNENLRGQPLDLFIEDAIEQTTLSTTGISAEYGRFAGGVVNVLTKSGGNTFSGSVRTNLTNDKWVAPTPVSTAERTDKINPRYEATLGGRLVRDRLWFFAAGRDLSTSLSAQTAISGLAFDTQRDQRRLEGKLTGALTPSHRLIAHYLDIEDAQLGNVFPSLERTGDLRSIDDRETPQSLKSANYTGNFTSNLFGELQYSEREFAFVGSGGNSRDRITGTWIEDNETAIRFFAPTFCGVCTPEDRNNENMLGKLSWFLSTERAGSHEIVGGYDRFKDIRLSNNFQSGSNFSIFSSRAIFAPGAEPIPVFDPSDTQIVYWPISQSSQGTDFVTNSMYLNDRWRINDKLSLSLGLRYDENDGVNAAGATVAKDSKLSPRLGLTYDLAGSGRWLLHASAGEYVPALANNIADSTSIAGTPSILVWAYDGPPINTDGTLVDSAEALRRLFAWFDSIGGITNTDPNIFIQNTVPGGTTRFPAEGLKSPSTREYSLGLTTRLGNRGSLRTDYVRREGRDFYLARIDHQTGTVVNNSGALADLQITTNAEDDLLERTYDGLHLAADYRLDRLSLGGGYALSQTQGNVVGESTGSGPLSSGAGIRPEFTEARWNFPKGDLPSDQRHRLRLWGAYRLLVSDRQSLSVSFLQGFDSGNPYGAAGSIPIRQFVVNPPVAQGGYVSRPTSVQYFFTNRDAFRTDDITSTSLSLNYAVNLDVGGTGIEFFLQPEVLNVFNEHGINNSAAIDTTVLTNLNSAGLTLFNPFTEQPVEGVHWRKGPNFGSALNTSAYQTPRTFRFSVGARF